MLYPGCTLAILACTASFANAVFFDAIQTPSEGQVLVAGTPFELVWTPLAVTGTATLQLLQGATNITLQPGPIIASSIPNQAGKYTWIPPSSGYTTYGWTIMLDSDASQIEYSKPFAIKASSGSPSTSSSSSSGVAPPTTKTVQVAQGPAYTSSSSSSSSSNTGAAGSTTSTFAGRVTPVPLGGANGTSSTLLATVTDAPSSTSSSGSDVVSSSSSATPAATSSGAAVVNFVSGGVAVFGGLVVALAL